MRIDVCDCEAGGGVGGQQTCEQAASLRRDVIRHLVLACEAIARGSVEQRRYGPKGGRGREGQGGAMRELLLGAV